MIAQISTLFSLLFLAAHGLRSGSGWLAVFWLMAGGLLYTPWRCKHLALAGLLAFGTWLWGDTALNLVELRLAHDLPWFRLAAILFAVCLLSLAATIMQGAKAWMHSTHTTTAQGVSFLLIVATLAFARDKSALAILLPDRFVPGSGWLLIFGLGCYGAWIVGKMADMSRSAEWRRRIWTLFSTIFFTQLLLGLIGAERLLMTGKLHLPVPALIAAGPLYRGEGLFMIILFTVTLALVGPAWCSHLCYIGAWDNLAADSRRRPAMLPGVTRILRWLICLAVLATAYLLGRSSLPVSLAITLAAAFGLLGVALMVLWSRKTGTMTHCITYCPMGLIANTLGRLNPWRIRIATGCNQCGRCARVCRYQALTPEDLRLYRAGHTCSLCGDCLSGCAHNHLYYHLPGVSPQIARMAFVVMIVSLHAVFLGVARL